MKQKSERAINMADERERLTYEYQYYKAQLEEMQKQMSSVRMVSEEMQGTILALEGLKETKEEALLPIGSATYVKAKVSPKSKVLIDIGARIILEKTPEEAKELLEKRKEDLAKTAEKIARNMEAIAGKMNEIASRISEQEAPE